VYVYARLAKRYIDAPIAHCRFEDGPTAFLESCTVIFDITERAADGFVQIVNK
jgi:hypothetical protein